VKRSEAAEQKSYPAAFHLESMNLDDGSLNSPQGFGNSILMLRLGWHGRGVVGLGKFEQAGHWLGCQEMTVY
jgi:hypothetical protein